MDNNINYIKIDSKNNISGIDNVYRGNLQSQLYFTISDLQGKFLLPEINRLLSNYLNKFEGDILEISKSISNQIRESLRKNNIQFSITNAMNKLLNNELLEPNLLFSKQTILDISYILVFCFENLEKYKDIYKIKTYADLKATIYDLNFNNIDLTNEYNFLKIGGLPPKIYNDEMGKKQRIKAYQYYNNSNFQLKQFEEFVELNKENNENPKLSKMSKNKIIKYKYNPSSKDVYLIPNELFILQSKYQFIKKLIFGIDEIDSSLFLNYYLILLNKEWLFRNVFEVELDFEYEEFQIDLINFFNKNLLKKMNEMNKILKTTMYENRYLSQFNTNKNNQSNTLNKKKTAIESVFNTIIEYHKNNKLDKKDKSDIIEKQNSPSNINNNVVDTPDIYLGNKNDIAGLSLIEEYLSNLDMITVLSVFVSRWSEIRTLYLHIPDSFSKEIEISMKERNIILKDYNFLNFFVDYDQINNLSSEFNSLDIKNFELILGLISNNPKLQILRLSLFNKDNWYSPSGLYKLSYENNIKFNQFYQQVNQLKNYINDDIDHLIIWKLLGPFQNNLEILLCLIIKKKKILKELTLNLDIPSILVDDEKYEITLIKFFINCFIIMAYENHSLQNINLFAPLLNFDSRKYPIINNILDQIEVNEKSNLSCINKLAIHCHFFCVNNISKLITYNLKDLFLGDLDEQSFIDLINYLTDEDYIKKSSLSSLKLSLDYHLSSFKSIRNEFFKLIEHYPSKLFEFLIFSNLILDENDFIKILNNINYNTVSKYLFEFNNKCLFNNILNSKNIYWIPPGYKTILTILINKLHNSCNSNSNKKAFYKIKEYLLNLKKMVILNKRI